MPRWGSIIEQDNFMDAFSLKQRKYVRRGLRRRIRNLVILTRQDSFAGAMRPDEALEVNRALIKVTESLDKFIRKI